MFSLVASHAVGYERADEVADQNADAKPGDEEPEHSHGRTPQKDARPAEAERASQGGNATHLCALRRRGDAGKLWKRDISAQAGTVQRRYATVRFRPKPKSIAYAYVTKGVGKPVEKHAN